MRGGYTKRALRQAIRGLTPELIRLGTRKIGKISPTKAWIREPLRSWLFDLTASRAFVESSVWNDLRHEQQSSGR